jgi:hypothetical protein
MVWQSVRTALIAAVVAVGAAASVRADDCCPSPCAPRPCTRTVYKTEWRQETYTAYRCECVPETRTRTCTVYKQVPETRTETRTVCVCVPTVEERTVMQTHVTCKPVTTTCRRCVDRGHWECREVPCESRCHRWGNRLRGLFHHHDCCDSCGNSCNTCCEPCCPPPTKTVRVWVPCKVWEEYPVTHMQRVCESRPVTCKVTVMRRELRQEQYQVTCCKCVPEQRTETYTVLTSRRVPYQATRCVPVCVPCVEQTPAPACGQCCEKPCCERSCHTCSFRHWRSRCNGLHFRHECCCD